MNEIITKAATESKPQTKENRGFNDKFTRLSNQIFDKGRYLTVKAKWVYATLKSFENTTTGATFPSYAKIKERSGLTRNEDVSNAIAELKEFGWLEKSRRFNKSNEYDLTVPVVMRPTKEHAAHWKQIKSRFRSFEVDKDIKKAKAKKVLEIEIFDNEEINDEPSECDCNLETCEACSIPF